jgi:UDP-glucose 4-epimerase
VREDGALCTNNPYGTTKLVGEQLLRELERAIRAGRLPACAINPAGATRAAWIGEDPRGAPSNLMPYVAQVASGAARPREVIGSDYGTHDGTGVRRLHST